VAAAALNFLPYIGALTTVVLVACISLISFDTLTYAMLAPLFVILCNIIEGQVITPLIVGRRLEINAVAIFIAVAFWSWLWGFVGALIAVPLLVVIKVFCDHFDSWRHIGNFLSAQQGLEQEEADAEADASQAKVAS
jgi:predicted PurR-regulated permease PerM